MFLWKVDEKAMIRIRYSRFHIRPQIPNGKGTQTIKMALSKVAKAENQEVSSFPADIHKAILNMNK